MEYLPGGDVMVRAGCFVLSLDVKLISGVRHTLHQHSGRRLCEG